MVLRGRAIFTFGLLVQVSTSLFPDSLLCRSVAGDEEAELKNGSGDSLVQEG